MYHYTLAHSRLGIANGCDTLSFLMIPEYSNVILTKHVETNCDMRTFVPLLYPCRQTEQENTGHRPGERNIYLRYL